MLCQLRSRMIITVTIWFANSKQWGDREERILKYMYIWSMVKEERSEKDREPMAFTLKGTLNITLCLVRGEEVEK